MRKTVIQTALGLAITLAAGATHALDMECGQLTNGYGPYDYRTAKPGQRRLVEDHHFTSQVERLEKGQSSYLGDDIDYTLRAFPNHPRALMAMRRLSERLKTPFPKGAKFHVECYFERAVRFAPDDATAHTLYGLYLTSHGKREDALARLRMADGLQKDSADVHYNLGLAYFSLGEHAKALEHAHQAYALGFPLPGLKNKLKQAGTWRDAPDANPAQ